MSNMYDWIDVTWNPLAGQCPHRCLYCSTNKFYYPTLKQKYSGELRIDEKALKKTFRNKRIFVCAQNDLFADAVPEEFISRIMQRVSELRLTKSGNTFYFQSKNMRRVRLWATEPYIYGTTIETYRKNIYTPDNIKERAKYLNFIKVTQGCSTFLTIEPIMDFDLQEMLELVHLATPNFINIGADSGKNNLPEPSKEKVLELIERLKGYEVKLKSNLIRLIKE